MPIPSDLEVNAMADKPKILVMRSYFFPETAASNQMCLDLLKALEREGFSVEVICPVPTRGVDDATRKQYGWGTNETYGKDIKVHRFWLPVEKKNVLARFLRYVMQNCYQIGYGLTHQYDLLFLYSTPPTNGLVGAVLRKVKGKPFVYNLHDIFPDSMLHTGMINEHSILFKIGKRVESITYNNANSIITLSEGMRRNILEKGVDARKVAVVYNWVDEKKVTPVDRELNPLFDEYCINRDSFIVTYAGNMGLAQSVMTIMEAADALKEDQRITFVLIGNGACEEQCKQFALAKGLPNVIFAPMQPSERISEVYSLGDISIVSCKAGIGKCGMPSKTGSIMSSETMLLASFDVDSELSEIVLTSGAGRVVPPEDSQALAREIKLICDEREKCNEFGRNGRLFLLENMTADVCTNRIVDIINSQLEEHL